MDCNLSRTKGTEHYLESRMPCERMYADIQTCPHRVRILLADQRCHFISALTLRSFSIMYKIERTYIFCGDFK